MRLILLILITLMIYGCSPVAATQTNTYVLKTFSNGYSLVNKSSSINLLVSEPTAPEWLATTNMAYQIHPSQLNYFSKNQWADTPAHLLQAAIVQGLQQSGQFHAVMTVPFAGNYDKRLDIRIFDFSQDFTAQPSCFHVKILAILVNGLSNKVVASKLIDVSVPSSQNSPAGGVQAANLAVTRLNSILLRMVLNSGN